MVGKTKTNDKKKHRDIHNQGWYSSDLTKWVNWRSIETKSTAKTQHNITLKLWIDFEIKSNSQRISINRIILQMWILHRLTCDRERTSVTVILVWWYLCWLCLPFTILCCVWNCVCFILLLLVVEHKNKNCLLALSLLSQKTFDSFGTYFFTLFIMSPFSRWLCRSCLEVCVRARVCI